MSENNQFKKNPRDVGALWKQKGDNGSYLSGNLTLNIEGKEVVVRVNVYKNDRKEEGSKAPDFRVYLAKEKTQGGEQAPRPAAPAPTRTQTTTRQPAAARPARAPQPAQAVSDDTDTF